MAQDAWAKEDFAECFADFRVELCLCRLLRPSTFSYFENKDSMFGPALSSSLCKYPPPYGYFELGQSWSLLPEPFGQDVAQFATAFAAVLSGEYSF